MVDFDARYDTFFLKVPLVSKIKKKVNKNELYVTNGMAETVKS